MSDTFEHAARPGNLGLSVLVFAGLTLLTAQLWPVLPGIVLLVLIPALTVSFCQMIVTPVYGLRVSREGWKIYEGASEFTVDAGEIAYLRIKDGEGEQRARVTLVLTDGMEIVLPPQATPEPLVLIREATNRGIPVRHI